MHSQMRKMPFSQSHRVNLIIESIWNIIARISDKLPSMLKNTKLKLNTDDISAGNELANMKMTAENWHNNRRKFSLWICQQYCWFESTLKCHGSNSKLSGFEIVCSNYVENICFVKWNSTNSCGMIIRFTLGWCQTVL